MRSYRLVLGVVAAAALYLVATHVARSAPADYTFHQIALSGDTFDPFGFEAPVINTVGSVAFNASRNNGKSGIFRGNGGALTAVAIEERFSRFGSPSINRAGQVGFEASLENISGEGIFRGDGGPITTIAGTRDAGDFDFVNARPSLNALRVVAFIGERIVGDSFIDGVYAGDGGPVSAIYDATGPFADFTGNPSLNNYGQAAFLATLDNGVSGLFLGSGGEVTTVADDTGEFTSAFGFSDPSLNERGEVAFRAGTNTEDPDDNSASTGEGIFLFTDGNLSTVVQGTFSDFSSLGDPSLNNRGQVAFVVEPASGGRVLVTGPDFVDDRVIGTGDQLLGRSINGLVFSREGLNDAGQLAFTAFFRDGSAGVFVATPQISGQPDLQIAKEGETKFSGNNIYNGTGFSQTRAQNIGSGETATYIIRLQNDSPDPADFRVIGTRSTSKFNVRYFNVATGKEITAEVTSAEGWRPRTMAVKAMRHIRLEVEPTAEATAGAKLEVLVTARSVFESAKRDAVKAITGTVE